MPKTNKKRIRNGSAPLWIKRGALVLALFLFAVVLTVCNILVHLPQSRKNGYFRRIPAPFNTALERLGQAFAELTDNWGMTGQDVAVSVERDFFDPDSPVCAGYPKPVKGRKKFPNLLILKRTGFVVGYVPELRHPLWVAYCVSPKVIPGPLPGKPPECRKDPEAPYSPEDRVYSRSGYDRGTLASDLAIAGRYGKKGQLETFLTSNICPRRPELNQGPWRDLEYRISEIWPRRYGNIWVIAGAFSGGRRRNIPGTGVDIPSGFYQIAVSLHDKKIRAFAVYMTQATSGKAYPRAYLVSIDDLENLTGLDFLSDLPDEIESRLESGVATRLWPSGLSGWGAFSCTRAPVR